MKILPKKEFVERIVEVGLEEGFSEEEARKEATSVGAIHITSTGEILVQKGAPSGFRLHEVGHKVLGHTDRYSDVETGARTIGDTIYDEVLAEKYSYDTKGKEPTYRLVIPAINMLVSRYGWSPESAIFWSLKILKDELDIIPTKSERRELARHARGLLRRPG